MDINYPAQIDTTKKKIAFVLRVIECFRMGRNFMVYWRDTGLNTETKYNNGLNQIPEPAKDWILDYAPYSSHGEFLSAADFKTFEDNKFEEHYKWMLHYQNIHKQAFRDDDSEDSLINLNTVLT